MSPHRALTMIAGRIGWPMVAEVTGRAERTVRNWSDPDTSACVSFAQILQLDAVFLEAGGDHAPLITCLLAQIDIAKAKAGACATRLAESAADAAEEMGEAVAAQLRALAPGAPRSALIVAEHETAEAAEAVNIALQNIRAAISGGAS